MELSLKPPTYKPTRVWVVGVGVGVGMDGGWLAMKSIAHRFCITRQWEEEQKKGQCCCCLHLQLQLPEAASIMMEITSVLWDFEGHLCRQLGIWLLSSDLMVAAKKLLFPCCGSMPVEELPTVLATGSLVFGITQKALLWLTSQVPVEFRALAPCWYLPAAHPSSQELWIYL